jgi:luciferase family oxidoreductase group 1
MLPHYSPLKVAESFSMLTGLFPARIDLGLGRAAGTSPIIARALQRDRRQPPPDDFREQLDELIRYFTVPEPAAGPFPRAVTARFESPAMWLLGSSPQSAVWAAELGLPYVFADFINPHGSDIARAYRQEFRPSERLTAPHSGVAAWVICAPTDEEGVRLSASLQMMMTMLFRGQTIPVPPVEKALRFLEEDGQSLELGSPMRRVIRGAPETVAAGIKALAEDYEADEVFAVNILHDHQARRRSYELLAEAVGVENTDATSA